ncbi:hypothetical protein BJY00DRAFT_273142 [Aspergillus carlsbadensis]|nr:hypothetical protein BJY00DRAFT_273142 [Aspergillus carlsbadensis]
MLIYGETCSSWALTPTSYFGFAIPLILCINPFVRVLDHQIRPSSFPITPLLFQ